MSQAMSKSTKLAPSFDEFRACVLAAYALIIRDLGFVELPPRQGEHLNKFAVRIGNGMAVIEVEGIGYGTAASTKIFRASDAEDNRYGLPIGALLRQRQGLDAKETRKRQTRRSKLPDQLGDIRDSAAAILEHARDVLAGDFTALDQIVARERLMREERQAKALPPEIKAAVVAASQAGHAFRRGDYRKVIELLKPHLPHLPQSQQKRFQMAQRSLATRQP
jgi:hypothetical protein